LRAIIKSKRACEKRLGSLTPALPTAYEGVVFTPPNTMYQSCQFLIQSPDDPVFGTGYYRERFDFQVFVIGQYSKGTLEVLERAELIRDHFHKGLTLVEEDITLHFLRTPKIAGTMISEGRTIVPILISVVSEVYS
jgi:hypothetical protein